MKDAIKYAIKIWLFSVIVGPILIAISSHRGDLFMVFLVFGFVFSIISWLLITLIIYLIKEFKLKAVTKKIIISLLLLSFSLTKSYAQIIDTSGYLIGSFVEIGINANGHEGALSIDGDHSRGGIGETHLGIVANPQMDSWVEYNGDYFMPGLPQNAFGLEINGTSYENNMQNTIVDVEPDIGGEIVSYSDDGNCLTLEWEGEVGGILVGVLYHLLKDALFYTTAVTLTNTNAETLDSVYYFRTMESDNNQPLTDEFATLNTIVSQSEPLCKKALVTAEQDLPWHSYIGFCAVGDNFRCSRGDYWVTSGSDIWNAAGEQIGEVGSAATADRAISLAYRIISFEPGATESFEFATVFTEASVDDAMANLFSINYDFGVGLETGHCNHLMDTVKIGCYGGNTVTLTIDGANASSYDWSWSPDTYLDETTGESVSSTPADTIVYTVVGTPIFDCFETEITKSIVVIPVGIGPSIVVIDPGPQCEEFDLTTLAFYDENDLPFTVSNYFSEIPDSADQIEPLFEEDIQLPGDEVYLMIGDTTGGCFDWVEIVIDFGISVNAGSDSTITVCAHSDSLIDLHGLIAEGTELGGTLLENTDSEQFDEITGELDLTSLDGTFTFDYIVEAEYPCANDTSSFTVIVNPLPTISISDDLTMASGETTILTGGGGISYNWSPTTGLSDPELATTDANPIETTTYTLTITDENGCENSAEVAVTIDGQVNIAETNQEIITLYPNPFTDYTTIHFNQPMDEEYHLVIYDMIGQIVYQKKSINETTLKIKKELLGNGVYVLSIQNSDNIQLQAIKLMVK